jgi:autotransporter-associated beta strand protein
LIARGFHFHYTSLVKSKFSSAAAIVVLTMSLPAAADVIYSNYLNTPIPLDFTGVTINVGGGSLNPFFGGVGVANNASLQPFRDGTGGLDTILNFGFGATINSSTITLANPGGFGGSIDHVGSTFTAGSEGYVGFKLDGSNYGWMRVVFTNNTGGALVKDWSYDNSGSSISVGGIQQVGQDVTLSSGFTLASAVVNSGGTTNLVKNGSGTNTLNATSTYTGSTTVNAGTLLVNGALAGTSGTSVASGATLGGTGSIANSVTVASGGSLSPGTASSIDSLGLGSLDLQGALLIEWDTTVSPNIDFLDIAGTLNLGSNSSITFTNLGVGSLDLNTPYVFAEYGPGGLTGTFNTVNLLPAGFTIDYNYGGLNQIAIVPEPGAALLGGLGLLMLLRRRRRH